MSNVIEEFSFKGSNEFSLFIESLAHEKQCSVLEAVLQFCEEHLIDPAELAPHISRSLKEKLEYDFIAANMLPKQSQLDFA